MRDNPYLDLVDQEEDQLQIKQQVLDRDPSRDPASDNPYESMLGAEQDREEVVHRVTVQEAVKKNPDQQTEVMKLSDSYGLPPSFVEKNIDTLRADQEKKKLGSVKQSNPYLAKALNDPNKMALVRDDLEKVKKADIIAGRFRIAKDPYLEKEGMMADLKLGVGISGLNTVKSTLYGMAALNPSEEVFEQIAKLNKRINTVASRQPKYYTEYRKKMHKEGKELDKAWTTLMQDSEKVWEKGVLEGIIQTANETGDLIVEGLDVIAAFAGNPKALMYGASESSINSFAPIIPGLAGFYAGTKAGGAVGMAIPAPGTAAAFAAVGGGLGFFAGQFALGSAIEFGLELESRLGDIDVTDPEALKAAFNDPELITYAKDKAAKKAITTSAIDSAFALLGGAFMKSGGPDL